MNSELLFNSDLLVGISQQSQTMKSRGDVRRSHMPVTPVTTPAWRSDFHLTCQSARRQNTHG